MRQRKRQTVKTKQQNGIVRRAAVFKNLQPISVGVWWRLPSSSEQVERLQTLMRIEVKFTSIPFL
jgi:hypothetical protein